MSFSAEGRGAGSGALDGSRRRAAPPGWRRKWQRVPVARRAAAAVALGDLFERHRTGTLLPTMLAVSLFLHAASVPLLIRDRGESAKQVIASEDSYLRKVVQKDRAKYVAADVANKATMPPPPQDPEKFTSDVLTESLTSDVSKVAGGLLNIKLQQEMTGHVAASLQDEIKAASEKIASGTMSDAQIRELHREFKEKAYKAAQGWREQHREEKQVDIATTSVTEWYQNRVASQLKQAIRDGLFGNGGLWAEFFTWRNQGTSPGFLGTTRHEAFIWKTRMLNSLSDGHVDNTSPRRGKFPELRLGNWGLSIPDWPSAGKEQARLFSGLLEEAYESWDEACLEYMRGYYPHHMDEMVKKKEAMSAQWKQILADTAAWSKKSAGGAPQTELAQAQAACVKGLQSLYAAAEGILINGSRRRKNVADAQYDTINQAMRSRVLRGPFRDEMYKYILDTFVARLQPAIESLAESQFREGIVMSDKAVAEAMRDFRVTAAALLRRDLEETISKTFFYDQLFFSGRNPYQSAVTGRSCPPSDEDIKGDEEALAKALAAWPPEERAFADKRAEGIKTEIKDAINRCVDELIPRLTTEDGRLARQYYAKSETVDYADPLQEKLDARAMAWKGRKQDLGDLTAEGVPDTSTPLVALIFGASKGQGVSLEPVLAPMYPGHLTEGSPAAAFRLSAPAFPPAPAPWGFVTQAEPAPPFKTANFEAIPFLTNFPNLDGDLGDWGAVRPLVLAQKSHPDDPTTKEPTLLYAAWNYQGFFFGYHVKQPRRKFLCPSQYERAPDGITLLKRPDWDDRWVGNGDSLILFFDTLDARLEFRGDPHTQEFRIYPLGTEGNGEIPGIERVIASRRDAQMPRALTRVFPPQPPIERGPDGKGPYRVTKITDEGYTVELFLPRSIFNNPVFAPGWYIGFDAYVGISVQSMGFSGDGWIHSSYNAGLAKYPPNAPRLWGDLLMLGTDARLAVQDAGQGWPRTQAIIPGHSYLVTVVDPDRNVNLAAADTVLVSAEVADVGPSRGVHGRAGDAEVYVLKETGPNTSVFRGYVNTQPGSGSAVQGMLELMPGQEVRFGYVDFADSKGRRNVVYEQRVPVASGVLAATPK